MGQVKNFFRVFQLIFVFNFIVVFNTASGRKTTTPAPKFRVDDNAKDRIPIGVVFDQNSIQVQQAFKIAMVQHTKNNTSDYLDFQVYVDVINTADTFKLSRLVCNQFSRGVVAILAAVHPDSFNTFHSYANTFHMPFVTPFFPEKVPTTTSGVPDYALSILPDYHKAVLETVSYYGWQNVIYLYETHDGMLRLQQLFRSLMPGKKPFFRIANVKKVGNAKDVISYLKELEKFDRWSNKYLILDCSTTVAKDTLISHVRDVQLGRRNYHYLFSGLVLDDRWDREVREYGTINMTGFQLVDRSRKYVKDFFNTWKFDSIAAKGALMYDAAHTVLDAFQRIVKYKPHIMENLMNRTNQKYRFLNCDTQEVTPLKYGDEIADFIRRSQIEGLSGKIQFSGAGVRKNFSLVVVRNNLDGDMVKLATWYDDRGFRPVKKLDGLDSGRFDRNKTYIIGSIHEPPYFISSRPPKITDTEEDLNNIDYDGFCFELAHLIAEKLQIKIQFRVTPDDKYGGVNPTYIGGWDGMVGQLVRKEVDMVIAPLIVTEEREAVIDFSNPFLSFVHIKKLEKQVSSALRFLKPLSRGTWFLIVFGLILATVAMYVVTRFSPMEWRVVTVTDTAPDLDAEVSVTRATVINKFSIWNTICYIVGMMLQRGSEISPRSAAGRIVSAAWWFFTINIVCSYTAYMASQLTLTGLESTYSPVYRKMAHCPGDIDAESKKGIIVDEEDNGNIDELSLIPAPKDDVKKVSNCEMLVSILDPGIRDFSVAFPKGSKLRTDVNLALAAIKKEGEMNRLVRKYFQRSRCDISEIFIGGTALTLSEFVGLFYVLLGGTVSGLVVALIELCNCHRSDAPRANISIKANSRPQVNKIQKTRNTIRRRRRNQERTNNGSGNAPGPYDGPLRTRNMAERCSQIGNRTGNASVQIRNQQATASQLYVKNKMQLNEPMPTIIENEQPIIKILNAEVIRRRSVTGSLNAPFGSSPRSPNARVPMRSVGPHPVNRHRYRPITRPEETRGAVEMKTYFTPTNQDGPEATALQNSFTQV